MQEINNYKSLFYKKERDLVLNYSKEVDGYVVDGITKEIMNDNKIFVNEDGRIKDLYADGDIEKIAKNGVKYLQKAKSEEIIFLAKTNKEIVNSWVNSIAAGEACMSGLVEEWLFDIGFYIGLAHAEPKIRRPKAKGDNLIGAVYKKFKEHCIIATDTEIINKLEEKIIYFYNKNNLIDKNFKDKYASYRAIKLGFDFAKEINR